MSFIRRYDRFGWDYPLLNRSPDAETLSWCLGHAREVGGPVLELACGTGSLLAELARAGFEVLGLDLSERMLGLARNRLADEPPEVRDRVALVRGNMADFRIGREFGLALIVDNSFREVETREGLLACLACVRRHLRADGRLLVQERGRRPKDLDGGERALPWSDPRIDPETGATVRRRIRIRVSPDGRTKTGVMTYRATHPDGRVEEEDFAFSGPILGPDDYLALFAESGFTAHLESEGPWLLVTATRSPRAPPSGRRRRGGRGGRTG